MNMSKNDVNLAHLPPILPVVLSCAYVFCSLLSNILSAKIILVPILNWAVDGGTILYPLSFVVRDMLHKSAGRKIARTTVVFSGVLVALMAMLIRLVIWLPPDPSWPLQSDFANALSSTWRLVFASISAQVLSNLLNTHLFGYALRRFPTKDVAVSIGSNIVCLLFDTILFCLLAFAFAYPWVVVLQIILLNLMLKFLTALIFAPLLKLVKRRIDIKDI
ncbi:MAG: queuosine precursor transporter [Spirochaetia bacterium]